MTCQVFHKNLQSQKKCTKKQIATAACLSQSATNHPKIHSNFWSLEGYITKLFMCLQIGIYKHAEEFSGGELLRIN